MSLLINELIKKYYKINNNYRHLIYEANKINLNIDEEITILETIIKKINALIYKYHENEEKELDENKNQALKELLIALNNIYNLIYQKILCYA